MIHFNCHFISGNKTQKKKIVKLKANRLKHHLYSNSRFPFKWNNPLGYLIVFSIEYFAGLTSLCVVTCQTTFIIGNSLMLISVAKIMKNDLLEIDAAAPATKENRLKLSNQLSQFVQLHSDTKQLSKKIGEKFPSQKI